MNKEVTKHYKKLDEILTKIERYKHMSEVINYDMETQTPIKGMDEHSSDLVELEGLIFNLSNSEEYKEAIVNLFASLDQIENPYDKRLITLLHEDYLRHKDLTEEANKRLSEVFNKAFISWSKAKEAKNYALFEETLGEIAKATNEKLSISKAKDHGNKLNNLMDEYENGMSTEMLDNFFNKLKEAIVPLLKKVRNSDVKIRTDFVSRKVPTHKQIEFAKYLLKTIGYDLTRGSLGFTEHPFTTSISKNDHRVTTHVYENNFISNIYSIIHEGGHGIFGQNIPEEAYVHHTSNTRSLGEDESVSRFFENRIGRSKEFIHLIYPKFKEIFKEEFFDVTEEELYLAVNEVVPGPIRTEADELTYTLHIIIRYEIEKDIVNNNISLKDLNKIWNQKYYDYLGVEVKNDQEGILQDIHRTGGFGYFPTYAIGNAYNAMYYNRMIKEIDVNNLILTNNIKEIVNWMKENIFDSACYLTPNEWIKKITGRELDPTDFINYLEDKYSSIYKTK